MSIAVGQFELYYVANKKNGQLIHLVAGPFIDSEQAEEYVESNGDYYMELVVVASDIDVEEV